jgi:Protein of unknown function (DUF3307)
MKPFRDPASSRFSQAPWDEVFLVFVVSHLVGDYLLQTEWQALNKHGGLRGSSVQRRALRSHIATYTLAFVPGLVWLCGSPRARVFGLTALIAVPHLIQDDGGLLGRYARLVKKADIQQNPSLGLALDQSFHLLTLFLTARLVGK